MLLFISFLLVMAGCVNWLLIGLLQFDFVAGLFGYQGSIFSRIIYIIIGAGALFFLFKILAQKGKIELFNFKKNKMRKHKEAYNVEASRENFTPRHKGGYSNDDGVSTHRSAERDSRFRDDYGENTFDQHGEYHKEYNNLFDEHFSNDD